MLIVILTVGFFQNYTRTSSDRIYLSPVFDDDCGWEIYTLDNDERQNLTPRQLFEHTGTTVYLSRVLTEDLEQAGITILELSGGASWQFSVFLDGELLYTVNPALDNRIGSVGFNAENNGLSGMGEYVRCTLPSGYVGKTLTLAAFKPDSSLNSLPMIRLSGEAIISEITVSSANQYGMPAAAYAAFTLFLLGLFLYNLLQGNQNWSLLLLVGASLTQSLNYLCGFEQYFSSHYTLNIPIAFFFPTLFVCLPMLFLLFHMKRWRKLCAFFVLVSITLSLVPPLLNMLPQPPQFSYTPFTESLYIGILALLVFSVLETKDKNQTFRFFLTGLGLVICSILVLNLCSLMGNGFYADYTVTVLRCMFLHFPQLPLFWCGTILFVLCTSISTILLMRNLVEQQQRYLYSQMEKNIMSAQLLAQKEYYEVKLGNEQELRHLKHDMQGHLTTTAALLTDGKTEEALGYLEDLTKHHQNRQVELICENPYLNAVITIFAERFQKNGILFKYSICLGNTSLPGPTLSLIMNNSLQNAQEAVLKLSEAERTISLQAAVQQQQLLIRIRNRFFGTLSQKNGLPVTTKSEPGHGYGLTSIRMAVEQLGGDLSYSTQNNRFELNIAIPEKHGAAAGGTRKA